MEWLGMQFVIENINCLIILNRFVKQSLQKAVSVKINFVLPHLNFFFRKLIGSVMTLILNGCKLVKYFGSQTDIKLTIKPI